MPQENPLKVTQVTRKQKRLVDDMESRNDILFDREVFTQVSRLENPMSPSVMFGRILGNMDEASADMFEPVGKGIGTEFIKIVQESSFQEHIRILDTSRVPDRLVAGQNFEVTIDRAAADSDETLMARDERTVFRVESRRPGTNGTDYTLQYVGIPGTSIPGAFLRVNDPLHVGYGNSKGEGSMNSNTLLTDLTKRTIFNNLSSIMRYGSSETGSAMADMLYEFAVTSGVDGSETKYVKTDIPVSLMRGALRAMDNALLYNVPNFNPRTKTIANQSAAGRYHERPYFAGLFWQLDQCPWKWRQSKNASLDEGVQKLDFILQFMYNQTGRKNKIVAMASGAGLEYLRKVILTGGLRKYGINIWQQVTGGDKLKIGFEAEEYYTPHGSIILYDTGMAMKKWGNFDRTSFGGVSYNERSNDIYLIPTVMDGKDGIPKKPANIYYKEGNGVSRAFAFGYMNGINGSNGTGYTADQIMNAQEEFIKKNLANQKYRMDSTVDGREMHVLMQMVPYIDVRNVAKLQLF